MLEFIKQEANKTVTENGAASYVTTKSDCLDLFATVGALRHASEDEIKARFIRAFCENKDIAMKLLFFARDVRGGLGERRVFKVILKWLAENEPETVKKNIAHVAEYGRYDDLLCLMGTPCEGVMLDYIKAQLEADLCALKEGGEVSLLGKWLPSINASSTKTVRNAKIIAKHLGLNDAGYRKALVALRAHIKILENNLRAKDYSFDYEKQPSKALFKYRSAFARNDGTRYKAFLGKVNSGEAKLNASTLAPYELVEPYVNDNYMTVAHHNFMRDITEEEKLTLNATWASLPHFGNNENAIAVVDTSGSMYWEANPMPASVALSLGLYFAEHNTGIYKNHFIEFSDNPRLIEIKGKTFVDRLRYVTSFNEVASTNLESVFDLILKSAVDNNVPNEELPARLVIISDMEFNYCVHDAKTTNFESAKAKFEAHGYTLPSIVFWNVASRNRQQPVTQNEEGVMLVSGCSPRLFEMVAGGIATPYAFMLEVIESERYAPIAA